MPIVSPMALICFLAIVSFVAIVFLVGSRSAFGSIRIPAAIVIVWLGVSATLAQTGLLRRFDLFPPPFLIFIAAFSLGTAVLAFSKVGDRLIEQIGIHYLVGFQIFRVLLEILLHRLYEEGVVPIQMTFAGSNFDILSGSLAAVVLIWGLIHRPPRWAIWMFNIIGLVLLINIVTIAILSTPTPLRRFMNEPANTFVAYHPYVWLPAFLVQAAWFGHLLVFRWLRRADETPKFRTS